MKTLRRSFTSSLATALLLGQPIVPALLTPQALAAETLPVKTDATSRVVAAANAFLATLDEVGRGKAVFAANDEVQKKNWSNLPTGIYKRAGLRYGDLTSAQRDAANAVLKAALSESGYRKTMEIVESDEVLKQSGQPGGIKFGRDEFYISFVGQPSPTDHWIIQFGGHHLALNISVIGRENILTPSHTAAQPAIYTVNGKTVHPLGGETDASFALIGALDESQRKDAILGTRFRDLVLPPGQEGKTVMPEGVKVSTFNAAQKALLLKVANEWVGMVNDAAAARKLDEIKSRLDETYFAWSGPITPGSAAYFRIHGPTVWIEFAPQQLGGDPLKHIHTMYRDPTDEYGAKFVKAAN